MKATAACKRTANYQTTQTTTRQTMKLCIRSLLLALGIGALSTPTHAQKAPDLASAGPETVVFVCLHGVAKSQVAAAQFNRIARERGLPFTALSRGIAVENEIPAGIRQGLAGEGLASQTPRPLTPDEAKRAAKVFAFDEVPAEMRGGAEITYWSGVPAASNNYSGAREAIVRRIDEIIASMKAGR